jgi:hypothetical protein
VLFVLPAIGWAQDPAGDPPAPANVAASALVTAHGMVKNAATGEPLARALVRIEGDANTGALTDGEGKFEIPGLASGPQIFEVLKPEFQDRPAGGDLALMDDGASSTHNVVVAVGMPDLEFFLAPTSAIRGHVELSTGDPAQGIEVQLLRRMVQDGRGVWQMAEQARTLSDGSYRFAGLPGGDYAVYSNPALDSESATTLVVPGRGAKVVREGYPSQFYPDGRDLAGAAKIHLASGEQAQANLNLTLEPFYAIAAAATFPGKAGAAGTDTDRSGTSYAAVVLDGQGHQLPYVAQYDPSTQTIQALLPDGTYSLMLTATPHWRVRLAALGSAETIPSHPWPLTGSVEFTVAGHAIADLRIPLAEPRTSPVRLTVAHSASQPGQQPPGQRVEIAITASQAGGWIGDGLATNFAQGDEAGPLDVDYIPPGPYWIHTHLGHSGLCETAFTAGGANLAREPLTLSLSGTTAPLELTASDSCAKLTLLLPAALAALPYLSAGEEHYYTVYAVPDFDSTADIEPVTLRPTSGASVTLEGLTPGSYHVYTFSSPVLLEYRNRDVLASLPDPGQAVTLSAGATASLVLETPGR